MGKYVSISQLRTQIQTSFASLKTYMDEKVRDPILNTAQQAKTLADSVVQRANAGEFNGTDGSDGRDGDDGTTFTPAVSASGVISWTNDGGKTNPPSVDIVEAVLSALPIWEGGSY